MSYVNFVSDEHLEKCVRILYEKYKETFNEIDLEKFYKNRIDPVKMQFDILFNQIDLNEWLFNEIRRKTDKTISNALGDFHQNIFDGIEGFEAPKQAGYDIRAFDNSLFAEVKNKHNTLNSSSAAETFRKLENFAGSYTNSTCYLVQIIAVKSMDKLWVFDATLNGRKIHYEHPRVRIISADLFYERLTNDPLAFQKIYSAVFKIAEEIVKGTNGENNFINKNTNKIYETLLKKAGEKEKIIRQIFSDNLKDYKGF